MSQSTARGGPVDWDLLFTFTLTLGVILLSGGTAWLLALGRVRRTAAAAAPPAAGGEWLLVPGKRLIAERPDGDFQARLRRGRTAGEWGGDYSGLPVFFEQADASAACMAEALTNLSGAEGGGKQP